MDESMIELILSGMGVSPGDPRYAAAASALRSQGSALSSTQGRWFDEDIRRFDAGNEISQAQVENQRRGIDNQYAIAKMGVKTDQERLALERWKAEQDNRIREAELAISQGNLELARERLGLDTELGRARVGIDRGAQGLNLLRETVDLNSQVRNWGKALDWRRGVRENADAPVFLRSLLENTGVTAGSAAPYMVAPQGLPEQNSLAAVLADLGVSPPGQPGAAQQQQATAATAGAGAGAGAAADKDPRDAALMAAVKAYTPSDADGYDMKDIAALKTIAAIARQGTVKSANRTAMLDKDEQDFLAGGMDRLGIGGDWWLRDAERRRVGQGSARVA